MSELEFSIIHRHFARASDRTAGRGVRVGIGDDAAVIDVAGRVAVTTDTLVADVHFFASIAPDALGYRAMAVNLSDLAAMGAEPRWCTLALTIPESDERWLADFARGFFELADRHGVALIGGDLTRGPLTVTVQALGVVGQHWLTRGGARPGDDVYVTGALGDAAAGLAVLGDCTAHQSTQHDRLAQRFLRPTPRVQEGIAIASIASAAIDVSDGLLADLGHICAASGCGAVIDVEALPLSDALRSVSAPEQAQERALAGGDDYELCFTAAAAQSSAVVAAVESCGTAVRRIGSVVTGRDVIVRRDGLPFVPSRRGYTHF